MISEWLKNFKSSINSPTGWILISKILLLSIARPYPKRVWAKINNCFLTIFPCRLTFLVIFEIPITKNGPNLYIRDTLILFIQITKFLKSSSNKFLRIF
jgi:hypothetical protein